MEELEVDRKLVAELVQWSDTQSLLSRTDTKDVEFKPRLAQGMLLVAHKLHRWYYRRESVCHIPAACALSRPVVDSSLFPRSVPDAGAGWHPNLSVVERLIPSSFQIPIQTNDYDGLSLEVLEVDDSFCPGQDYDSNQQDIIDAES